jgi:aldose 1-epimerase
MHILDNEQDVEAIKNERWYKGAILVPFPNRVRSGAYDFNGEHYQLPINFSGEGHAIHGLMYDKSFEIITTDFTEKGSLTVHYKYNGSVKGFPFPCAVSYTFSLFESKFSCDISVKNTGTKILPLGVGWHPYFTLDTDVDDLQLKMPNVSTIEVDESMIPTGKKDSMNDYENLIQIHDTQFDTGFEILNKNEVATIKIYNPVNNLTLESWQKTGDKGFNYVQVFTPPGRKSIAIEPMTCPANAFNSKESLIELLPQDEWLGSFGVRTY